MMDVVAVSWYMIYSSADAIQWQIKPPSDGVIAPPDELVAANPESPILCGEALPAVRSVPPPVDATSPVPLV